MGDVRMVSVRDTRIRGVRDTHTLSIDLPLVRARRHEATQSLLGDTISITDEEWSLSSRLPGWTRAHVATHIARNADGFSRVMDQLRDGQPTSLYRSAAANREDIERGSERTALELQVDLDASAGRLHSRFPELMALPPDRLVRLSPSLTIRLDRMPLARLNEVVLHHIDLDVGFTYADIEPDVAAWLLTYNADRVGRTSTYPAVRIVSDSGVTAVIGGAGRPTVVHGQDNLLLGWITGRLNRKQIDKRLPPLPCR